MTDLERMDELETGLPWKTKMLLGGAAIGAFLGVGTAFLLARTSEEKRGGPPEFQTMDALKIAISLFGLIRGIAALGDD